MCQAQVYVLVKTETENQLRNGNPTYGKIDRSLLTDEAIQASCAYYILGTVKALHKLINPPTILSTAIILN